MQFLPRVVAVKLFVFYLWFLYSFLLRKTEYIVIVQERGGGKRGHMVLLKSL